MVSRGDQLRNGTISDDTQGAIMQIQARAQCMKNRTPPRAPQKLFFAMFVFFWFSILGQTVRPAGSLPSGDAAGIRAQSPKANGWRARQYERSNMPAPLFAIFLRGNRAENFAISIWS